uniref:Reverse transcriptase domain-containing protein n=1 Tax=Schistosoma mansoni TaxID=6183 RepID=A0A5K4F6W1_SCHMA
MLFEKLNKYGLAVNPDKCEFGKQSLTSVLQSTMITPIIFLRKATRDANKI